MTRKEFENLVCKAYKIKADYPFEGDLETGVFRHTGSGKWFAIAMKVAPKKLGRAGEGMLDIANLKCPPEIVESLVGGEEGIYPAYHMNKMHWLTVDLGECAPGTVSWLLKISFELTSRKKGGNT